MVLRSGKISESEVLPELCVVQHVFCFLRKSRERKERAAGTREKKGSRGKSESVKY